MWTTDTASAAVVTSLLHHFLRTPFPPSDIYIYIYERSCEGRKKNRTVCAFRRKKERRKKKGATVQRFRSNATMRRLRCWQRGGAHLAPCVVTPVNAAAGPTIIDASLSKWRVHHPLPVIFLRSFSHYPMTCTLLFPFFLSHSFLIRTYIHVYTHTKSLLLLSYDFYCDITLITLSMTCVCVYICFNLSFWYHTRTHVCNFDRSWIFFFKRKERRVLGVNKLALTHY